jgi:hypothetical protein
MCHLNVKTTNKELVELAEEARRYQRLLLIARMALMTVTTFFILEI